MINTRVFDNFYCIEGVNGVGKTTIIEKLKEKSKQYPDMKFFFLKEPQPFIHSAVKFVEDNFDGNKDALAHLYLASRLYTIKNKENGIHKILKDANYNGSLNDNSKNSKIIIDRYELSTWVYQDSCFQGAPWIFPFPAKLFYIYADVEVLKKRPNCPKDIQAHLMKYNNKLNAISEEYNKTQVYRFINNNLDDLEYNVDIIFQLIVNDYYSTEYC